MDQKSLETISNNYEKLIPQVDHGHLSYDLRLEMQQVLGEKRDIEAYEKGSAKIEKLLRSLSFSELEVDLLLDRLVSDMPLDELASKYGFYNRKQLWRYINKLIKKLKSYPEIITSLKKPYGENQ